MSLFTGLSPIHHGVTSVKSVLPAGVPTLAGKLQGLGYYTVGVLCNPCAAGKIGFERGFDLYDDVTILADLELDVFGVGEAGKKKCFYATPTSKRTTDLVLRHLEKVPRDRPYFVFVLYFDPHHDYVPAGEYATMFDPDYRGTADGDMQSLPYKHTFRNPRDLQHVRALYDGEIRQTDDEIGRLLDTLHKKGRYSDDDLLILTSDHGEEFCEHGGLRHGPTLYEEVVRVPLVMRWPGKLTAGKDVPDLVELDDLFPTLVQVAGGGSLEGLPGTSLVELARGQTKIVREAVGMHTDVLGEVVGVRTTEWAVIRDVAGGKVEAFNLRDDPGQTKPLDPTQSAEAKRLLGLLDKWVEEESVRAAKLARPGTQADMTEQQIRALKSLGYMR
jgi:arylsulfatase A-like enzyme